MFQRLFLAISLFTNVILGIAFFADWSKPTAPNVLPDREPTIPSRSYPPNQGDQQAETPSPARSASTWIHTRWPDTQKALRDLGFSDEQCYLVAEKLIENQLMRDRRLVVFGDGDKIWQQGFVGAKLSEEKRLQIAELERQREMLLAEALGPDYRRIRALAAYKDNPKYSWLPEEKLVAVAQIIQDNDRIGADARRTAGRDFKPEEGSQLKRALETELREAITPDEYERLQAYTSADATALQRGLAGATISDEQYLAVYRALKNAGVADVTKSLDQTIRVIESEAGGDAALHYVSSYDLAYAPTVPLFREMGLTAAEILARRRRASDYFSAADGSPISAGGAYADITKGMTAAQKAVFDHTMMGRTLLSQMEGPKTHP